MSGRRKRHGTSTADDLLVAGSILESPRGQGRAARAAFEPRCSKPRSRSSPAAGRSTTAAPVSSATGSWSATCGSAWSAPTGSSPAGRQAVPSGSSWSIAPTKFDLGHGHDHRGADVSTEDRNVTTRSDLSCPSCGAPLQRRRPVLRAVRGAARRTDSPPTATSAPSSISGSRPRSAIKASSTTATRIRSTSRSRTSRNVAVVMCDGISSASAGNVAARRRRQGRRVPCSRRRSPIPARTHATPSSKRSRLPWKPWSRSSGRRGSNASTRRARSCRRCAGMARSRSAGSATVARTGSTPTTPASSRSTTPSPRRGSPRAC